MSESPKKPTEWLVARALAYERYARNTVMPRYTPRNWWECDLFELTPAGYFREYEIKLTRSDFLADARKSREDHVAVGGKWEKRVLVKYEQIRRRDPGCPSQFWYVAPQGMIRREELPEFAGLIEFAWHPQTLLHMTEHLVVPAPRLHQIKADSNLDDHIRASCYWRMHKMIFGNVGPLEDFWNIPDMPEP